MKDLTISVSAKCYEDEDDCLTAAALDHAMAHDCQGYDLRPRWEDEERERILLDLPEWATLGELIRYLSVGADGEPYLTPFVWRPDTGGIRLARAWEVEALPHLVED